ncbi:unnamed protein product [Malassezia sympodialis ATCC 42132]|uniref:Glutaredoxin-like protein n=1 Tax=Malassezia sympodialis (strain ATCC 42132) TaxID=1230383 RepID=M5EAC2_MALS4|nr:uncharacterized protein MSY001_2472 [Malassezia sympodialis ATCC 42132]CCU99766.1 unnamed protein product [Malassezia sympodialis ATCC 42132]SHO76736.1 Similar to S.cerevisiae protein YDR286C (Putative protein of unknown function) [Malassezia sympodialis ATCC 42132]|eukprot:XP_018740998.1 uncharacterized protein MSY001_2472 [Malassezia sympodialis ATCC 42132]
MARALSSCAQKPHLTLFTGTHCSLCDDMKEVLDTVRLTTPFTLALYNIRDDSAPNVKHWRRKYQYDIPVLHVRWGAARSEDDYGTELVRHRAEAGALAEALLRSRPSESQPSRV